MWETIAAWTAFGVTSRLYSNFVKNAPLSATPLRTLGLGLIFGTVGYFYHGIKEDYNRIDEALIQKAIERKRKEMEMKA